MAPEAMPPDNIFSFKTDVYMFGIFLWEALARSIPYPGLGHRQAGEMVKDPAVNLRPEIPLDWPLGYVQLMEQCWHKDPNLRPSMAQVFERLHYLEETRALEDSWGGLASTAKISQQLAHDKDYVPADVPEWAAAAAAAAHAEATEVLQLRQQVLQLSKEFEAIKAMASQQAVFKAATKWKKAALRLKEATSKAVEKRHRQGSKKLKKTESKRPSKSQEGSKKLQLPVEASTTTSSLPSSTPLSSPCSPFPFTSADSDGALANSSISGPPAASQTAAPAASNSALDTSSNTARSLLPSGAAVRQQENTGVGAGGKVSREELAFMNTSPGPGNNRTMNSSSKSPLSPEVVTIHPSSPNTKTKKVCHV